MRFPIELRGEARFVRIPPSWSNLGGDEIERRVADAGGPTLADARAIGFIAHVPNERTTRRTYRHAVRRRCFPNY